MGALDNWSSKIKIGGGSGRGSEYRDDEKDQSDASGDTGGGTDTGGLDVGNWDLQSIPGDDSGGSGNSGGPRDRKSFTVGESFVGDGNNNRHDRKAFKTEKSSEITDNTDDSSGGSGGGFDPMGAADSALGDLGFSGIDTGEATEKVVGGSVAGEAGKNLADQYDFDPAAALDPSGNNDPTISGEGEQQGVSVVDEVSGAAGGYLDQLGYDPRDPGDDGTGDGGNGDQPEKGNNPNRDESTQTRRDMAKWRQQQAQQREQFMSSLLRSQKAFREQLMQGIAKIGNTSRKDMGVAPPTGRPGGSGGGDGGGGLFSNPLVLAGGAAAAGVGGYYLLSYLGIL